MKERQLSCGGDRGEEGKAPLQHRKSGNKDLGKVLIELKMPLPVAEGLDSMALRGPFHPKPFCDSVIPKDQPGRSHTAKGFSSHQNSPHRTRRDAPPALGKSSRCISFPKGCSTPRSHCHTPATLQHLSRGGSGLRPNFAWNIHRHSSRNTRI